MHRRLPVQYIGSYRLGSYYFLYWNRLGTCEQQLGCFELERSRFLIKVSLYDSRTLGTGPLIRFMIRLLLSWSLCWSSDSSPMTPTPSQPSPGVQLCACPCQTTLNFHHPLWPISTVLMDLVTAVSWRDQSMMSSKTNCSSDSTFVNPNVHTVAERKLTTSPSPSLSKIRGLIAITIHWPLWPVQPYHWQTLSLI